MSPTATKIFTRSSRCEPTLEKRTSQCPRSNRKNPIKNVACSDSGVNPTRKRVTTRFLRRKVSQRNCQPHAPFTHSKVEEPIFEIRRPQCPRSNRNNPIKYVECSDSRLNPTRKKLRHDFCAAKCHRETANHMRLSHIPKSRSQYLRYGDRNSRVRTART